LIELFEMSDPGRRLFSYSRGSGMISLKLGFRD
jgi:hypothetical protein